MKRFVMSAFLALVVVSAPACSIFTDCVRPNAPTWSGTVSELADVVAAFLLCDPGFTGPQAPACAIQSLEDLALSLGPNGKAIVDCIIAKHAQTASGQLQARARAVAAKRGINLSKLECGDVRL